MGDLLEEHAVLLDARDPERVRDSPDGGDEVVVLDVERVPLARLAFIVEALGVGGSARDLFRRCVDVDARRLVVLPALLGDGPSDGLDDGSLLDGARGGAGEERGVEEVVPGRDEDDVVRGVGGEGLDEGHRAPARAEDDHLLAAGALGRGDLVGRGLRGGLGDGGADGRAGPSCFGLGRRARPHGDAPEGDAARRVHRGLEHSAAGI